MHQSIEEGYDLVLEAENAGDSKRLERLYQKYLESDGLEADLIGVPGAYVKLVVRPKRQPHETAGECVPEEE